MKKILIGMLFVVSIAKPFQAENRLSLAEVRSYRFETVPEISLRVANMIWSLKKTRYVQERVINGVYTLVFRHRNHEVRCAFPGQDKELSVLIGALVICDRGLDGIVDVDTTDGKINDFFYSKDCKFIVVAYPKLPLSVRQIANYQYSRILISIYEYMVTVKSDLRLGTAKDLA